MITARPLWKASGFLEWFTQPAPRGILGLGDRKMEATYSPDDNKLRLYAGGRLDPETYAQVKAAGFKWAPKQELFVAPMWTPEREDVLIELCGEVEDEDKSLVERAEERAERFEDYSDNRAQDAERAREAVASVADGIPFGQPILVGHHSEKHARRDAKRIENGMRKAVQMWETSQYWQSRAKGAIRAAKYKERPDVRARRIKGIEADKRKQERYKEESELCLKLWSKEGLTHEQGLAIAGRFRLILSRKTGDREDFNQNPSAYDALSNSYPSLYAPRTLEEVIEAAKRVYPRAIAHCQRWINHYENRIAYERAMLEETGGTATDKTGPEKGGACKCWASPRGGFSYIQKVNKVSVTVLDNWGNGGGNFTRTIPFDKLSSIMTVAEINEKRSAGLIVDTQDGTGFFLRVEPPKETREEPKPELDGSAFQAMKDQLKNGGVKVVSAHQLFPTPIDIAERMADLAEIQPGDRVLEPSAGTGRLIGAMGGRMFGHNPERGGVVAIEINHSLVSLLESQFPLTEVKCTDFLECNGDLGKFDAVIMNPPFENAVDIKHIKHAITMLKPGGRLVAICANGPRQNEQLRPLVESMGGEWEVLPAGTFIESGTGVNTVLLSMSI